MTSLTGWIRKNRVKIDEFTKSPYKNDEERRLWVLNDEGLYNSFKRNINL